MISKIFTKFPLKLKRNLFLRIVYWKIINAYYGIKHQIHYGASDIFHEINIETITTCNRRCTYCPNFTHERSLPKNEILMEEEVFKKIIDNLASIKFCGVISPIFYGEALIDKRLINLLSYAHQKLPQATLKLTSNGDLLTIPTYKELIKAGVEEFVVTQHSKEISHNMSLLMEHFGKKPHNLTQKTFIIRTEKDANNNPKKITFLYQKLDLFYNRGGLVDLKENDEKISFESNPLPICYYYSNPLIITAKGNVPLCCQDYHETIVFGNVKEIPLLDIWNSPRFKKMRKELNKRNYLLPICKACVGCESKLTAN